jgi:tRNA modification GTPase
MTHPVDETIYALSTPQGVGAIGVIRISGPEAITLTNKIFRGKDLSKALSHTAHFGRIMDGSLTLDEVVAVVFRGPRSYTGQDTVELSCHGSPYILQQVMHLLGAQGGRLAQPGEFTMRAFLNGKLDLSQAEAVADLIASESAAGHRVAMAQMRGGFSEELKELRASLLHFAALIELELDFAEEDVAFADRTALLATVAQIRAVLQRLTDSFALGNAIKKGVPVAIVGAPNAGKSTLLNALLKEERALVSDIPGTTRDTVEDEIHLEGMTFRFIDTAGLRDTTDVVEAMGIARSWEKIKAARMVLHLVDARTPADERARQKADVQREAGETPVITVLTKSDLCPGLAAEEGTLILAAKLGTGLDELKQALLREVQADRVGTDQTIVTNARHQEALLKADQAMALVDRALRTGLSGDLLAEDLRQALFHLGEITGQVLPDDILGTIFSSFCIGK